jgi:hypothetical protein
VILRVLSWRGLLGEPVERFVEAIRLLNLHQMTGSGNGEQLVAVNHASPSSW